VAVIHSLTKVKGVMGQKSALQNTVVGVEGDLNVTGAVTFRKVTGLEMLLLRDDKVFIPKLTHVESALSAAENSASKIAKEAKTWFNPSPFIKGKLSLLLRKEDERKFPEVYRQVIQAKKSEWRSRGQ
jgi:hypothetical protein